MNNCREKEVYYNNVLGEETSSHGYTRVNIIYNSAFLGLQ